MRCTPLAICCVRQLPALLLCSSASSSSSAEDGLDLQEAAVERCVRLATPALIAGGTYEHQSKVGYCQHHSTAYEVSPPPPSP